LSNDYELVLYILRDFLHCLILYTPAILTYRVYQLYEYIVLTVKVMCPESGMYEVPSSERLSNSCTEHVLLNCT